MAVTLTEPAVAEGTVHVSFPILKWEQDEDGDLVVKGVATDGTLDSDEQVVSPEWSAKALDAWISTGGNVRMSHDPRRPVGKGLQVEVNKDGSGKHWVTSVIVDRDAQKLIKKGVLTAYSVGIARPVIKHDPTGKARGGIIVGGELCELSVVDRPSNKNSYLEIAKAAADGTCEFTGKVFGADAADAEMVSVDLPPGAQISISPADFAKLRTFKQDLVTKTAAVAEDREDAAVKAIAAVEVPVYKRDIDTATRRRLASEGHALPDGSYPIENAGDLHNAAILARSGHGDVAGAERLIAREARERGVANPMDDGTSKGTVTETAEKSDAPEVQDEAVPDVAKDEPVKKGKKKPKGPKKLPPWLNKPTDGDSDADDSCKQDHVHTEKCRTTPAEAAGLSGSHDMSCAPVPELMESDPVPSMTVKTGPTPQSASDADEAETMDPAPTGELLDTPPPVSAKDAAEAGMMKASPEVAAILRFKGAGIDIELGRLHDLTCPAFHPEDVAKCHPFSDLRMIDADAFQRKAVAAACGPDLAYAKSLNMAWQAAFILKGADPGQVNDFRLAAHKAFRDANPGPTSAPTPGMMTPGKYNRPLITDGHEASSTGHDGPNSSPQVATSAPSAHGFDRPPLSAGHQSPSPSHMKQDFPYPDGTGRPQQLNYAVMEKEKARMALVQMHEHLSRQFPEVCPMDLDRPVAQPESRGVPAAVGKAAEPAPAVTEPPAVIKVTAEDDGQVMDADVWKGFKKQRKKLGKKVLAGKLTVDEARARMGRQFAQKAAEPEPEAAKAAAIQPANADAPAPLTAALIKSAVAEALQAQSVPLEAVTVEAFDPSPAIEAAVAKAVTPLLEKIRAQDTKLAETQRVIDAIADQPDPGTAAFSGLAYNPVRKQARPAGVPATAEIAERTQQMMIRHLQDKYNANSDPAEREAYYGTLAKMRGYTEQ